MEIRVLASSSAGNCYWISDGKTSLLLEAGIRFEEIRKGVRFQVSTIAGCLVSHEHGDHAKSVADVMKAGVDVYASAGTIEALGISGHRVRTLKVLEPVRIGTWTILPFDTVHDAVEPLGFVLASTTGAKLLYLTDSAYCKYRFKGLTHLMVEANYSAEILRRNVESGVLHPAQYKRVLRNHMSLERLLEMLAANDLSQVREIWLLHLSDGNSDEAAFKAAVERATGKPVYVARR